MEETKIDGLTVRLIYVGDDLPKWEKDQQQHRRYIVAVEGKDQDGMTITETFNFWGSVAGHEEGRDTTPPKEAFQMVLDDGFSALTFPTVDEFAAEMGYTDKPSEALRVWEECRRTARKLERLGLDEDKITELLNKLREEE